MTYFHINLDPRGKKKSFAANSYTRDYIGVCFFFYSVVFFSLNFFFFFFFFLSGLSKTRLQGGNVGDHSAIRCPKGATSGLRVQAIRRPAETPLRGGLPSSSSSACTVYFFKLFCFRCSVLTPVLFQNTSVECVSLCAQEHTPFNIVPACLPACLPSVPLLSRQNVTCLYL